MKVLAISDTVIDWIYSPQIRPRFSDINMVIGCGDLPHYYLEYIISALDIPVFYVQGNHSTLLEMCDQHPYQKSQGSVDLHCKVVRYNGITIAGVEGSLRYKEGLYQYSQLEMWLNVIYIVPSLILNRIRFGRFINIFISHAPPWGIHDQPDLTHQGIKAFRWLIEKFQPDYHFHGHIHVYRPDIVTQTTFAKTQVINAYGYRVVDL